MSLGIVGFRSQPRSWIFIILEDCDLLTTVKWLIFWLWERILQVHWMRYMKHTPFNRAKKLDIWSAPNRAFELEFYLWNEQNWLSEIYVICFIKCCPSLIPKLIWRGMRESWTLRRTNKELSIRIMKFGFWGPNSGQIKNMVKVSKSGSVKPQFWCFFALSMYQAWSSHSRPQIGAGARALQYFQNQRASKP